MRRHKGLSFVAVCEITDTTLVLLPIQSGGRIFTEPITMPSLAFACFVKQELVGQQILIASSVAL